MSYGQWKISINETIKEFGYNPNNFTPGSTKPVKCVCETCGVVANKRFRESTAKHRCNPIIDNKKRCFKCKKTKPVEEFSKNRSSFDGYQKVCKECFSNYDSVKKGYRKQSLKIKTNLEDYLRRTTTKLQRRSELKNIECDLDNKFLYELYQKQQGKCYFSNIEIKHNEGCHQYDSISVERLIPHLGYTKDNIVLSSFAVNSFKGMMNEIEFKESLKKIIPNLINYSDR